MNDLKNNFIDFINEKLLRFGDFTLKSGDSPYYFNTGLCNSDLSLDL